MTSALFAVMRGIGKLAAAVLLAMLLIGGWTWWDMRRLRSFCEDIHTGMSLAMLPGIAEQHGIHRGCLERGGIYDERTRDWVLLVPAAFTMGDLVCAIHHDKVSVVSAKAWGP